MSWLFQTVSNAFSTAFDFDVNKVSVGNGCMNWFSSITCYERLQQATLSGALDVVAVRHDDGVYKSTPFHVRFGKLKVSLTHFPHACRLTMNFTMVVRCFATKIRV